MENAFKWASSPTGMWARTLSGIVLLAVGYTLFIYPLNMVIMSVGGILLLSVLLSGTVYQFLFGKPENTAADHTPQMEGQNRDSYGEPKPHRATFKTGSTTQGGSNYGQGTTHLGPASYQQGSEKTSGSDYANEQDRLAEENDAQN